MADAYVTSAWRFGNRIRTAWRAWKAPHIARVMLDAYDSGQAVVTVNATTWRLDGDLVVQAMPGTPLVSLEHEPILHIDRITL